MGVCGPMRNVYVEGIRYFVIFVDDVWRKIWGYMMKSKKNGWKG